MQWLALQLLCWLIQINAVATILLQKHARVASQRARQRLENQVDTLYVAGITLGNQYIKAVMDTGSHDFLVFGRDCWTCGDAAVYTGAISPNFVRGNGVKSTGYGSGYCNSAEGFDTVEVAGLQAVQQEFWEAYDCQMPLLLSSDFQAIMGIAPRPKDEWPSLKSFPDRVGVTVFSICYGRDPGSPGYLVWNDERPQWSPGVFTLPVIGARTWSVAVMGAAFQQDDSTSTEVGCSSGCAGIVDSGTTYLGVDTAFFDNVWKHISGLGMDCSDISRFPKLRFRFGEGYIDLPPEAYIRDVVTSAVLKDDANPVLANVSNVRSSPFHGEDARNEGPDRVQCELLVMDIGNITTEFGLEIVLGMDVFRQYYVTFDQGDGAHSRSISFARPTSDCNPLPEGSNLKSFGHTQYGSSSGLWERRPAKIRASDMRVPHIPNGSL